MRRALTLVVLLGAAVVAGCGGSSDQTLSVGGGGTITVPSDVHGVYGELEAILDQLPYQQWYRQCVVGEFEKELSPAEAEALSDLPEGEGEEKATAATAKAEEVCEAKTDRLVIDPNASGEELDLLRASTIAPVVEAAEAQEFTSSQVACVENRFQTLPDNLLIKFRDASQQAGKVILLTIFKACAAVK